MVRHYKYEILAPKVANYDPAFAAYKVNEGRYQAKLDAVQRLRGRLYLQDGAIDATSLDSEGRFHMCGDDEAWHLMLIDVCGEVVGCARYLVYPNTVPYRLLRISHSAIGLDPQWSSTLRSAVEADLRTARQRDLLYVEIGGWALSEEWRKTKAALETAACSYALGHLWGGTLGSCTATLRHGSASILRRIGGSSLAAHGRTLPTYFDPRFGCVMELLRFDYLTPWPRMRPMIEEMKQCLATTQVLTGRLEFGQVGGGSLGPEPFLRRAI